MPKGGLLRAIALGNITKDGTWGRAAGGDGAAEKTTAKPKVKFCRASKYRHSRPTPNHNSITTTKRRFAFQGITYVVSALLSVAVSGDACCQWVESGQTTLHR